MPESSAYILLAIGYLTVKHMLGDFFLQTPYQYLHKGQYGHPGGLLHALIHVVLTAPVFLLLPPASAVSAAIILLAEYVTHYHIDWLKEKVVRSGKLTTDCPRFWYALGVDQLAHYLTYLAIVGYLISDLSQ